jgi:hypothetical protein
MKYLLTGGFLSGHRSYLLGALVALQAVVGWMVGDFDLAQLIEKLPEILGGLGLMSLRAGLASAVAGVAREATNAMDEQPSPSGTKLSAHPVAAALAIGLTLFLVACASPPPETARERMFVVEHSYAAVVDSAAVAVEAGLLSTEQIKSINEARVLVREVIDGAAVMIGTGDEYGADQALLEAAALLDRLALIVGDRSNE